MNRSKNKKLLTSIAIAVLCTIHTSAQFGDSRLEYHDINKEMEILDAKRKERQRIIEHNEWVSSEICRLQNGKQAGFLMMVLGGILSCAGVLMQITKSNKHIT